LVAARAGAELGTRPALQIEPCAQKSLQIKANLHLAELPSGVRSDSAAWLRSRLLNKITYLQAYFKFGRRSDDLRKSKKPYEISTE
tara:strand:- start:5219 stop:5476 length:258 start_codon:yes stop_codon:yes gene_type:complete